MVSLGIIGTASLILPGRPPGTSFALGPMEEVRLYSITELHSMIAKNAHHKRRTGKGYPPYDVHVLTSWEAFLDTITDSPLSNWAFRGQSNATWPLFSTLSRYFLAFRVHPEAWRAQEARSLRIFKRKAHQFLPHI